jgi:hypothetical protein
VPQITGNENQAAVRRPQYTSNEWLSHGFRKAKNDEELHLQREAHAYFKLHPDQGMPVQLEHIYRQLAYMNSITQFSEARKTPAEFHTYTVLLNLFGHAEAGAVDQVLPANPSRKQLHIYASNGNCFISWKRIQTIPDPTLLTPLQVHDYAFIPEAVRWPLDSNAALYAISSSTSSASQCTLTIVEELFNLPKTLRSEYALAVQHEANAVQKSDWLEDLDAASVDRRKAGNW